MRVSSSDTGTYVGTACVDLKFVGGYARVHVDDCSGKGSDFMWKKRRFVRKILEIDVTNIH
jgi:hypothetical protein